MAKKKAGPKLASFTSSKKKRVTNTKFTTADHDSAPAPEKPHVKKQTHLAGDGFDLPPAIQSIENAADELFDIEDNLKTLKAKKEKVSATVLGLRRAAKRMIYKYRDRTIRIEGKEKLKIEAPRLRSTERTKRARSVWRTEPWNTNSS